MFSRWILDTTVRIDNVVVKLSLIKTEDRISGSDPVVGVFDRARPGAVDELYVIVV